MGRDLLLEKINDAKEGLPETILAYLDREINNVNVKAPKDYFGKKLSELIKEDITYTSSYRKSRIKAVIGKVGSGKTILLNNFKEHFLKMLNNQGMVFFLNLSDISVTNNKDFAKDISKSIYDQIKEYYDFLKLNEYGEDQLFDYFNDFDMIGAIKNIRISEYNAKKYFFSKITEGNLIELLEGYLKIAFSKNYPVLFIIDELNYLIKNDPNEKKILTNIIVQRLQRGWWQKFTEQPLLLITACLETEFSELAKLNPSFYSVIKENIIELDKFSKKEQRGLIELVYNEYKQYLSENIDLNNFIDKIEKKFEDIKDKGKLDFYIKEYARGFVQIIATIMSENINIDHLRKSYEIYEEDARNYIKPILQEKGYDINSIPDREYKYDGFGIDIYAENKSKRQGIIHALGECKSRKFNSKYVDDWEFNLLKLEKKGSYNKNSDFIFTMAPEYTKSAKDRLKQIGCKIYTYTSGRAENLAKLSVKNKEKKKKVAKRKAKKIKKKTKIKPLFEEEKKLFLDDLTRAEEEVCLYIKNKGGKVGIITLKKQFGDEKAIRLIKELEKRNKIVKVKRSYKLK